MAKKSDNDPKKNTLARIRRTEAYAERVRTLFAATVNEILALNKSLPTLEDGEMFSFDTVGIKKQHEVERLLRQLHSVATMAIQSGVKLEWAQANAECDKLVQSCFGKKALETPEFSAWTQRNEAAMAAFIARSENGLNLSQRVWKSCRQLRDEMEVAITVAVGDGTSAATMSRSVRKYLNDPDLMFRRFRYKDPETGEWKRKWKKRVIGEDGKVHFIDYDKDSYQDEWTGPGYYKSSAQNAMRVARTETNIAYRRADNTRWQQMDFVLGQRVQLSRNHPKKDICDKLAGDYPPDFVFDGWHPQCFCFVTPILMDEEEIQKMNEAMLEGKEYKPRGKRITQYPENFKEWVRDNEDKILASHDIGTDPYFVRNNFNAVQDILNPKEQLTPLEIAEQRHANRTPEQEEKIRLAWQERKDRIEAEKRAAEAERLRIERINNAAQNVLKVAQTRFADFDIDTVALDVAVQSGDTAVINAETRALAKKLSEKQQQLKKTANNVLNVASKWQEVSSSALEDAIKSGNLSQIQSETKSLAQRISAMKLREEALKSLIPDVHKQHEDFTIEELEIAHDKIKDTLKRWPIDINSETSLITAKKGLEHEVTWMGTPGKGMKYKTWRISQAAYQRELDRVNHRLDMLRIKQSISLSIATLSTSRSVVAKQLVNDFNALFSNDSCDLTQLRLKADEIKDKATQLEEAKKKRDAKKAAAKVAASVASASSASGYTPKSDAEVKKDFISYMKSLGHTISEAEVVVQNGFIHCQGEQHRYLYNALKPETSTERAQLWNHKGASRWGAAGYVQTGNSWRINSDFRTTKVTGALDATAVATLKANGATADDIKTMKLLDKKISEFSLPIPIVVTRYVQFSALDSIFGMPLCAAVRSASDTRKALKKEIDKLCGSKAQADPAYLSASTNEAKNVFTHYSVKLMIEVPPGTPMYLTNNYQESEIVLGRSTQYVLLSTEVKDTSYGYRSQTHLVLHCRIIN
jgi:hypothetical protein